MPTRSPAGAPGAPPREFLYVDDAAEAIAAAAAQYSGAEPVNLGSGQEITIADLIELIAELVGFRGEIVWDHSKPDGQPRRWLDTARAEQAFGFRAGTELREGLRQTIDWYRSCNRSTAVEATSAPARS